MFEKLTQECPSSGNLSLRCFVDTGYSIQAAGVTDVGQALGYHPNEKGLVIAQIHIALGMACQLGFTAALSCQKAEGDHLPLGQGKATAGIVIPKAVSRQPAVDMTGLPCLQHLRTEDIRLGLSAFF